MRMSVWQKGLARLRGIGVARLEYGLLAGIVLLATALRFYKLGEWSFWVDEIYTIERARSNFSLGAILKYWPPISIILTGAVLQATGISEYSARLVAAIVGALSVPILYLPTRRLLGPAVALTAALLLAVSPWHLYWSQNARFYTTLMLLYALAMFAFYFALERDRPVYSLAFSFLLVVAARERLVALFLIPVVILYVLLIKWLPFEKPAGFRRRNLSLMLLPLAAIAVFDAVGFAAYGKSYIVESIAYFVGNPIDSPIRILILIAFNIGLPLASIALAGAVFGISRYDRLALFLLLGGSVPPLLLAAISPFVFTVDRYVFVTLPCWVTLAAWAIKSLFEHTTGDARVFAAGILLLLMTDAAGAYLMYQVNHGNRLEWREALEFVQERRREGDVVVSSVPEVVGYYAGEEIVELAEIDPDKMASGSARYWFLIDSENGAWAPRRRRWVEANAVLIEERFLRTHENMHLRIYLYDPARPAAR